MAKPVTSKAKKAAATGTRIWLPGTPDEIAAVQADARKRFMRIGAYLMQLATDKRNHNTATPAA